MEDHARATGKGPSASTGVGGSGGVLFEDDELDAPVARVAQEEVPMPYNERLEAAVLPSEEKILQAVYQVCYL